MPPTKWYQSHKTIRTLEYIITALYTLKTEDKNEIKRLIEKIKENKNNIRNIDLELMQEFHERFSFNTKREEHKVIKRMEFIDKFLEFLKYWNQIETS